MQWGQCANIKDDEAAILEPACDNILFFVLQFSPKALDTSKHLTNLEETFNVKFKDLSKNLHEKGS